MKFMSIAGLLLLASATAASATCVTSALKGNWSVALSDGRVSQWCDIAVASTGVVTTSTTACRFNGNSTLGKLKLSSTCAVTGKIGDLTVTGRTDSAPNMLMLKMTGPETDGVIGFRKP